MPLLRKQLFERQKPPHDLRPDEEVFFCKLTKEVFRDYDAFFERIILCNSLVWSCSVTGHPNLTYQEALDSEAKARKALENFPRELIQPILYLVTLTRRGKQPDVMDDVFVYARDRFFIGEIVEAVIDSTWCDTKVMKVIPPTEREIAAYKSAAQSPSPSKSTLMNLGRKKFWPPPQLYKYELEEIEPEDTDMIQIHVIDAEEIRREKGLYTREKSQLFLRQCLELGPDGFCRLKEKASRKYRIPEMKFEDIFAGPLPNFEKTPSYQKPSLKIQKVNQMPLTAKKTLSPKQKQKDEKKRVKNEKVEKPSPSTKEKPKQAKVKESKDQKYKKKKKDKKETKKQSTLDQWVKTDGKKAKEKSKDKNQEKELQKKKNNGHHEEQKKKKLTAEEIEQEMLRIREQRERFKEDMKRRAEELKQKRLEERAKERAKMKEEKKLLNEYMQEWSKARDDLGMFV